MQNHTSRAFSAYKERVKKENDTELVCASFGVAPTVAQRLTVVQKESVEFLKHINILPTSDIDGESAGLLTGGSIAARTDTDSGGKRKPRNADVAANPYLCVKTEFDIQIPFNVLDAWAKFPDFEDKLEQAIEYQKSLDQITIGWHGLEAVDETDRVEFPLLQDVNVGWLEKIRTKAPLQVKAAATISAGAAGDFKTLDAAVYAAIKMLAPWHQSHPGLVCLISRDTLHTKLLENVNAVDSIVAELALNRILASGKIAGLPICEAPSFPDGALMVTTLDNLSIYYQEGSQRRFMIEEPSLDVLANYFTQNECYVVEDYERAALIESITFLEAEPAAE